jgi:hypothetical protein
VLGTRIGFKSMKSHRIQAATGSAGVAGAALRRVFPRSLKISSF